MKINKIVRIEGYRIFKDFRWPNTLSDFRKYNLIYGWNGTGKTTLAELFKCLQDQTAINLGNVVYDIDGRLIKGDEIPTATLPKVRVFNRDVASAKVFTTNDQVAPIYYFGNDAPQKKREVEQLKNDLTLAKDNKNNAESELKCAQKSLDEFYIAKAKIIKELLISSNTTTYHNYDKRPFKQAIEKLASSSLEASPSSDADKERLRRQKDAQPKNLINEVRYEIPDFDALTSSTNELLSQFVISTVIECLVKDSELTRWVQTGLELHTGDRLSDDCKFCGQKLPHGRISELQAHFNDSFSRFQFELKSKASQIDRDLKLIKNISLPDSSRFYEHLVSDFDLAMTNANEIFQQAADYLDYLRKHLEAKLELPFSQMFLDQQITIPERAKINEAIFKINDSINKHNTMTKQFKSEVDAACQRLEECFVAESLPEYKQLREAAEKAQGLFEEANDEKNSLEKQIEDIERDIREHRQPAEELNAEIHEYLGRNDLQFEIKDNGYSLRRNGQLANHLSDGEKTAISFLYFLKSLQDESFDLSNGIVVIDDPVSSLDNNSLFSAFSYMKERTKNAGQLVVLSHNFYFFRLVKNWFNHINGKKDHVRYYMLCTERNDSVDRLADLKQLDPLLEKYDSEYYYLFKLVLDESNRPSDALRPYMPNLARRLLEAFLAFRYPDCCKNNELALHKALERTKFDDRKKTRIIRFLNIYSHAGRIGEAEDESWALSEASLVLKDIMELIQQEDQGHYNGMINAISIT